MTTLKSLLTMLGAAMLLGALVSTVSARNLSTTNQVMRASFREVRFRMPFGDTTCALTLEGSLHARTFAKVVGSLIGYLTRVNLGPCSAGSATILTATLPWHFQYRSFIGTLPSIDFFEFNVVGWSERVIEPGGLPCLIRSTAAEPYIAVFIREIGAAIGSAEVKGTIRTGAECFGAAASAVSDRGPVTVAGAATKITVTLI